MSLKKDVAGLENMFDENTSDNVDLSRATIELFAANDEFDEAIAVVKKITNAYNVLKEINDEYQIIKDTIDEHGICKSTMKACDPHETLISNKYFDGTEITSYDQLPEAPIKNDTSKTVSNKLGDTLKEWKNKTIAFFKKIWKSLNEAFIKIVQVFTKSEKVLKGLSTKLDNLEVDSKKLKDKKLKLPEQKTISKALVSLSAGGIMTKVSELLLDILTDEKNAKARTKATVVSEFFDEWNKQKGLMDVLGFELKAIEIVSKKEGGTLVKNVTAKDLDSLGYKDSAICNKLIESSQDITALTKSIPDTQKAWNSAIDAIEAGVKSMDDSTEENAKKVMEWVNMCKKAVNTNTKITSALMVNCRKAVAFVITACNGVIDCKK